MAPHQLDYYTREQDVPALIFDATPNTSRCNARQAGKNTGARQPANGSISREGRPGARQSEQRLRAQSNWRKQPPLTLIGHRLRKGHRLSRKWCCEIQPCPPILVDKGNGGWNPKAPAGPDYGPARYPSLDSKLCLKQSASTKPTSPGRAGFRP